MASSIISFPDLNNLLFYKNRYIKPVLTDDDYGYYILNDTEDTYILTNVSPTNKKINIEAFVVGGGGAGGYYNGNGGDGGTVIYKSLSIDPNTTLELTVGKGAFYVSDTRYNNGFLVKLYEGFITDFFETQKSYLMNMKPTDTITNGLNKIWEQKVNSIASLKTIIENDNYDVYNRYFFFANNSKNTKLDGHVVYELHPYFFSLSKERNYPLELTLMSARYIIDQYDYLSDERNLVLEYILDVADDKNESIYARSECADILLTLGEGNEIIFGEQVIEELGNLYNENKNYY